MRATSTRRAPEAVVRFRPMAAYQIPGTESDEVRDRQTIAENAWALEVFDNPDVLPRVRAVVPADMVVPFDHVAATSQIYRLRVEMPSMDWECANCGALFEDGEVEALTIGNPHPDEPKGVRQAWPTARLALRPAVYRDGCCSLRGDPDGREPVTDTQTFGRGSTSTRWSCRSIATSCRPVSPRGPISYPRSSRSATLVDAFGGDSPRAPNSGDRKLGVVGSVTSSGARGGVRPACATGSARLAFGHGCVASNRRSTTSAMSSLGTASATRARMMSRAIRSAGPTVVAAQRRWNPTSIASPRRSMRPSV